MKFTSAITFLSLSACISPTFGKKTKGKGKADEIPSSLCDSIVQCGGEAYDGEVKLTEDLYCTQTTSEDCAITLEGEDAVLDCNQFMIDGDSSSGRGICIRNGATAINCHVQKFNDGIDVENGGEVKDCQVMFNDEYGIRIVNEASSTTKMKISNTYIHDNVADGINFFGYGDSPKSSETSIEVNNVKSNHNGESGMIFRGSNVKLQVKDSETNNGLSNNGAGGIYIEAAAADVELDGIISRYNGNRGLTVSSFNAEVNVKVKGDVNLHKNENSGFLVGDVDVVVDRRGALNSCDNDGTDIYNVGGLATFSGNGYTCTDTDTDPPDIITCDPCPCPQPQ